MRKIAFLLFAIAATSVFFTACRRVDDIAATQETITTSEDLADLETIYQDVEDNADAEIETRGPENECPTITFAQPQGTFPNTITIDYGTEGCPGPNGHIRKGQIVIEVSDTMINAGATRTVNLVDFSIDDIALTGTRTVVNNGLNTEGLPSFTRTVTNASATWPNDGGTATWQNTHTAVMTAGFGTATWFDNEWSITGSGNGVGRNGKVWSSTVTTPLVRRAGCPWMVSGIREVTVNDHTATIDYGFTVLASQDCDKKALLTLPNGNTRIITIRH